MVEWREAKIHMLTHALHYASAVFEGERAYGGRIFKSAEHSRRLKDSARILDFEIPWTVDQIDAAKADVLKRNGFTDAYVCARIRLARLRDDGASRRSINTIPSRHRRLGLAELFRPRAADAGHPARYRRLSGGPDPATAPALAKAAGLYMICTISKHRAERRGFADALMMDWQGRVAECTGANVFFVKDGTIHTPIADCFLAGITRATVIDLARRRRIEVIERRIMPDELGGFSECFITGSAAEVTPVGEEIGPHSYAPGAITAALSDAYTAEVNPKTKAA